MQVEAQHFAPQPAGCVRLDRLVASGLQPVACQRHPQLEALGVEQPVLAHAKFGVGVPLGAHVLGRGAVRQHLHHQIGQRILPQLVGQPALPRRRPQRHEQVRHQHPVPVALPVVQEQVRTHRRGRQVLPQRVVPERGLAQMIVALSHAVLNEVAVFVAAHRRQRHVAVQAVGGPAGRPRRAANPPAVDLGSLLRFHA